jgi:hypothetical protein
MKRLAILAAFAFVMSTDAAMADPCGGGNCATDEPVVTAPQLVPLPEPQPLMPPPCQPKTDRGHRVILICPR